MRINADIEIDLDDDDLATYVCGTRTFTEAVESVIENMDLQQQIEDTLDAMDVPSEDRVDDIAREVARDEVRDYFGSASGEQEIKEIIEDTLADLGIPRTAQVSLQAQARIEALEAQVAQLQAVLRDIAHVINPQPIAIGPIGS